MCRSQGQTADDQAIVGVIDGSKVLLTNFRGTVIPPPMCAATLTHSHEINRIGFVRHSSGDANPNRFFVLDATNTFSTYECIVERDPERNSNLLHEARLINSYTLSDDVLQSMGPNHWIWLDAEHVIYCKYFDGTTTKVYLAKLNDSTTSLDILDAIDVDGVIGCSVASDMNDAIICSLTNGEILSIEIDSSHFVRPSHPNDLITFNLDGFAKHIDCITVDGALKIVTLQRGAIAVDGIELANSITSFALSGEFVLATTYDQLKFIRMRRADAVVINDRQTENNSELIVAVPNDSRVVLQMPRGNLEVIQPRVLSICIIGKLLDAHKYHKAFDILRKQRINLNLLVDHNPRDFLQHISTFVENIANTQWLNLFLSDLQSDDVTATMYDGNYKHLADRHEAHTEAFGTSDKIDIICERCCVYFTEHESAAYLLPMITAHVKRKNIEAALTIIWQIRLNELRQSADQTKVTANSAHEALKYLLYLVNVNDLYDVALGMYDFELVLFVAQKSQKDPKEYLPFLNELKQLEENYRKFRIDNHLKRYEKALSHIVECGVEKLDECLELIQKHNLYTLAVRAFKPSDVCYNDAVLQYADHLRSKGLFYEASLMYERGADFKQACLSAKHTLNWKRCVQLTKKAGYSPEETEKFCL